MPPPKKGLTGGEEIGGGGGPGGCPGYSLPECIGQSSQPLSTSRSNDPKPQNATRVRTRTQQVRRVMEARKPFTSAGRNPGNPHKNPKSQKQRHFYRKPQTIHTKTQNPRKTKGIKTRPKAPKASPSLAKSCPPSPSPGDCTAGRETSASLEKPGQNAKKKEKDGTANN